jgi:hypothetical protein
MTSAREQRADLTWSRQRRSPSAYRGERELARMNVDVIVTAGKCVIRRAENRQLCILKIMKRMLRPYRYLTLRGQDRGNPYLVRERIRCGKPSCGCAGDATRRHGPYVYLRYEEHDAGTGEFAIVENTFLRVSCRGYSDGLGGPGRPVPGVEQSWPPTPLRSRDDVSGTPPSPCEEGHITPPQREMISRP